MRKLSLTRKGSPLSTKSGKKEVKRLLAWCKKSVIDIFNSLIYYYSIHLLQSLNEAVNWNELDTAQFICRIPQHVYGCYTMSRENSLRCSTKMLIFFMYTIWKCTHLTEYIYRQYTIGEHERHGYSLMTKTTKEAMQIPEATPRFYSLLREKQLQWQKIPLLLLARKWHLTDFGVVFSNIDASMVV